ncbi:MAG TPA: glycosyltransferase family 87 protein [Urbifossiella sp.]|nr:glycosyltransferase family 87 protein [Urbifossiella sp.]
MSATYAPPSAPTRRRWVTAALVAVPVAWCVAVLAVMRPDAVVAREEVPFEIKWLLYDESDLTALALRGANAHMGRLPGRMDEPETITDPEVFVAQLDAEPEPLADRYYLEYPTPTLTLFRLGFLHQPRRPDLLPPVVADAQQFAVGFFHPRTEAEQATWAVLHDGVVAIVVVMAASLVGMILILRRGYEPGDPRPWAWLCVLPGAVFFSLNRFDVLPAMLTAAGFALLARRRDGWSGAAFAVAALLKIYPVLLAPVILRHLGLRRGAVWASTFAGVGLAVMSLSVWGLGWESTVGPIKVQLSREYVEKSWTLYGEVLPEWLAKPEQGRERLAILAAAVLLVAVTRPAGLPGLLRRCGMVLVVFVVLAVFWSPQWIVWFLPLLAPLAPRRWWVGGAVVLLDVANYFNFPVLFWILWNRIESQDVLDDLSGAMIWVRAALWLGLGAGLVYDEWRAKRAERRSATGVAV